MRGGRGGGRGGGGGGGEGWLVVKVELGGFRAGVGIGVGNEVGIEHLLSAG